MPRGKKRGRGNLVVGSFHSEGLDAGLSTGTGVVSDGSFSCCGTCGQVIGDEANCIGCDRCSLWFHCSSICTGLADPLIKSIRDYGGDAIAFICTDCRVKGIGNGGVSGRAASEVSMAAFGQLFQTVKKLCESVQILTSQVSDHIKGCASPLNSTGSGGAVTDISQSEPLRLMVREEIRELDERRKRKDSLIIRGLNADSNNSFRGLFSQLTNFLISKDVPLSSISSIGQSGKLFRIKIVDAELRSQLLDKAKDLRNTEYKHVYINRDLTYKQRQSLASRKFGRSSGGTGQTQGGQTDTVTLDTSRPPASYVPSGQTRQSNRLSATSLN